MLLGSRDSFEQERVLDFSVSPFLPLPSPPFSSWLVCCSLSLSTTGVMAGQGLTLAETVLPQFSKQTDASLLETQKGKTTFHMFIRTGCNTKGVNFPQNLKHCNGKQIFCSSELLIGVSKIIVVWEIQGKQLKLTTFREGCTGLNSLGFVKTVALFLKPSVNVEWFF